MNQLSYSLFRLIRGCVKAVYPKTEIVGELPDEPCVIVCNHAQIHGPIVGELYVPAEKYIWCAEEMMELKKVPAYAYQDFWSGKPHSVRWFYKILSYLIAPLSVCVFNRASTIAVRRNRRILETFYESLVKLRQGANLVIFPEHDAPYDHIICDFQNGFINLAKNYYKETGKELLFVPAYLSPALKKMVLGSPIRFSADAPFKEERNRICRELMAAVSAMACSLPRHKVVPYNNVPKKEYGYNITEEAEHEKTGG